MKIQDQAVIHAPVEVVWAVTTDIEHLPEATPTVTKAEPLDPVPLAVGGRARLTQPGLSTRVWTVTEIEPDRVFEWSTKMLGVRMTGRHELRSVPDGCENTLSIDLSGPGSGLLGRFARRRMTESLATENAGFRRVAEARVARNA
jgi:uncharacterized membrane protein